MYVLVNPYDGYDVKLASVIKKFGGVLKKPRCCKKNGICEILSSSMMTDDKIQNTLEQTIKKAKDVKEIIIIALNEFDHKLLVDMSVKHNWGKINEDVNVKIVCEKD